MYIKKALFLISAVSILPFVTSCVDDKYDLSDIDTTVKVDVNHLTIPVNIDQIDLSSIIDLDEEDNIKVIDGQYVIVEEGDFNSDEINIPDITLSTPHIPTSETVINLKGASSMLRAVDSWEYDLKSNESVYDFKSTIVSEMIVSIDYLGCELSLDINISLDGVSQYVNGFTFKNVVLQIPKGLKLTDAAGGNYNPSTGELTFTQIRVNGSASDLHLVANGLDFKQSGGAYDYQNSTISVPGSMYIKSGTVLVQSSDIKAGITSLPQQIKLVTSYTLSDAHVASFSGKVRYDIDGADLTDVSLSDLPDVLTQESTNLSFVNPMIYLQIDNPLQSYNIYARTGLKISAYRGDVASDYSLDNPYFQIGPDNADGIYNFCLSPSMPSSIDAAFAGAQHVPFTSLSNVLSGNGIPDKLVINLVSPMIPDQQVADFRLGQSLGSMHGKYKFMAPLQFTDGSTIVYSDKIDGWSSEDLDHVTVTELEVTLTVSTDVPVSVDFTGYPIDVNGKRINNVEIVGAQINANASQQKLTIRITGEITRLDGIEFVAKAKAGANAGVLKPDMKITLSDIRPVVSGYYEKEL